MKKITSSKGRFLLYAGAIAFAGWICRMIGGFQLLAADPSVAEPSKVTDMATYLTLSKQILSGNFPSEFYYQPFYYSVFLPVVQLLTGGGVAGVIVVQAFLGAFAAFLAGTIALRLNGKIAGYTAVTLCSFSAMAIVYTPYCLLETLQSFLIVLLLAVTLEAWKRDRIWLWLVTGVILACSILTRGNSWIFLPLVFAAVWYSKRPKEHKQKMAVLAACGAVLLGTVLPQLPFVVVNSIERGTLSGPSTAGGNVLALGNSPEAPAGGLVYPESYQLWMEKEKEVSIPRRMLMWAKEEPMAYMELQFRKVLLFWDQREIPNNISPERSIAISPFLNSLQFIPTGVILVLALTGILFSIKGMLLGRDRLFVAILFPVFYCLAMAAFYILARFRVPAIPVICVAGGVGLQRVLDSLKKRPDRRRRGLYAGLAIILSYFLVYAAYNRYGSSYEPGLMRSFRSHGVDVPARDGGRLFYDHGPMMLGGWRAEHHTVLIKMFNPRTPVPAGTPVRISVYAIRSEGPALAAVNGSVQDLGMIKPGRPVQLTFTLPWPEDNAFRFEFEGNVNCFTDWNRNYSRTFKGDGLPLGGELTAEVHTFPPGK